ncbi:hypothetical protein ACFX11_044408 [Malus domestica]
MGGVPVDECSNTISMPSSWDGWNSRGCYGVFGVVVNDDVACVVVPSVAVTGDDMTGWVKRDFRQHTRSIFSR